MDLSVVGVPGSLSKRVVHGVRRSTFTNVGPPVPPVVVESPRHEGLRYRPLTPGDSAPTGRETGRGRHGAGA